MPNVSHSRTAKGLSIALVAIFALASLTSIAQMASAQPTGMPDTYTVSWQKESPYETNNWTWTNIEWIYGPSITIDVAYLNGTSLIGPSGAFPSHYLYPDEQFYINITIPKSILELGRNLSNIYFGMSKYQSYYNGTMSIGLWSANVYLSYQAYPVQYGSSSGYPPSSDPWTFQSSFYNYSSTEYGSGGGGGVPYPPSPPPATALFIPNQAACSFVETDDLYAVWFQGAMNGSIGISGTFYYYFSAMDTKGSQISTTHQYGGNLVLIEPDPTSGYGYGGDYASYNSYVTDLDGKKTSTVNPGTAFKIVAEFSGTTSIVKNMTFYLPCPVNWEWWDSETKNSRDLESYKYFSAYTWEYNYTSSTWQYVLRDYIWESRMIRITCQPGIGITIDEGFQYWLNVGPGWGNSTKFFEVNKTDSSNFYNLNATASDYDLSDNKIQIVLEIPTSANASAGTYWFDTESFRTDGGRIYGYGSQQFTILGDNVVKMGLLKEKTDDPLLKITPGKYFRAVMKVAGTQAFRDVLTGQTTNITFYFSTPSIYRWWTVGDVEYWRSSYLKILVTRNSIASETYVEVFNQTYDGSYNRATSTSDYNYSEEKLTSWNQYVGMGRNNFTAIYDGSSNILTLAFNLTFLSGSLPEGYFSWDAYLENRTTYGGGYYWFESYEWSSNMTLRYTKLRVPDNSYSILVGNTQSYWYWWSTEQSWKVDPGNGALDLDGSNATKNDQFYVKRIYSSTSYWTLSGQRMFVNLNWGSYSMNSYFALLNYSWRYEWSELYIWIYPNNRSTVPSDRFVSQVNNTIWDSEDQAVRPEYCQISYLTMNKTWDKIKSEYSQYSWWNEEYTWTWLDINFNQNFYTPTQYGGSFNNLFFQYAGLLLFNDTNDNGVLNMGFSSGSASAGELSHYFMFENAGGIQLTTPGSGDNGTIQVSVNDPTSWGVTVLSMNGTTYPAQVYGYSGFAGLNWWWHDCYGTYTPEGNFSTVPSKVGIDSLSFTAHFQIPNANLTAGAINEVRVKIDEGVGAWTLFDQPQSQISNYSMAIAFLASSQNWQYSMQTTGGDSVQTDGDSQASDYYNITQNGVKLANIQMGGAEYTWDKTGSNYTMHSSTTPMSAFTAMYSSYSMTGSGGASTCSFSVTGSNYFMTSSFKYWDGYSVYTDPYFAVFQSNAPGQGPGGGGGGGLGGIQPILLIGAASLAIVVVAVLVITRRRKPLPKRTS